MTGAHDEERDERIKNEVIVDAYTPWEQSLGWYYYLEDKMRFPFQARCIEARTVSPLRVGETVRVVGMPDEADCRSEMFVLVECLDREFGVPLTQLDGVDVDRDTREAVADWHHWHGDGGRLG